MGEKPLVGRAYGSPMRGRGARREERSVQTQTQLLNSNLHLVAKHRSCYLITVAKALREKADGVFILPVYSAWWQPLLLQLPVRATIPWQADAHTLMPGPQVPNADRRKQRRLRFRLAAYIVWW